MRLRWLLVIVPLLLVLLLAALPARLLWDIIQPELPASTAQQFSLQGISGSWWSGQAASLVWLGAHRGQLQWQLQPPASLQLALQHPQQQVQARLALSDVSFRNQRLRLQAIDASMLAAALPQLWPDIRLQGQLQAELQQLELQYNRQLLLQGQIRWLDARLTGAAALELGDVMLTLTPQTDHTRVQLSNRPGADGGQAIELLGQGTLHADRYALQMRLRPLPGHDELHQQLAWLGQRQPDGSYQLDLQGRWQ
ncbi:MAG: type II secretion system protein N [Gammaproteobacteria bacterium]|nr:type II secretion system protein N [Gammaproteobacteria bacterium]